MLAHGAAQIISDSVVLVDPADRVIGAAPKLEVHQTGALHRAFSVFIFDSQQSLLLQQRARAKYHSGGLWTNSCCGHPRPEEPTATAAERRLREEMGLACTLHHAGRFVYQSAVGSELVEHEVDHVFVGRTDRDPRPDPAEVGGWRRVTVDDLRRELARTPKRFTVWFQPALELALRALSTSRLAR